MINITWAYVLYLLFEGVSIQHAKFNGFLSMCK
jgi:hypothetical protein